MITNILIVVFFLMFICGVIGGVCYFMWSDILFNNTKYKRVLNIILTIMVIGFIGTIITVGYDYINV